MTTDTNAKAHIYIDADLHRQAKIAAVTSGVTLIEWIETAVRARLAEPKS